jgi:hypothetical protein
MGMMPRKVVHDWSTHHAERQTISATIRTLPFPQIIEAGFLCDCTQLVAESPFEEAAAIFTSAFLCRRDVEQSLVELHSNQFFTGLIQLRGPPAFC